MPARVAFLILALSALSLPAPVLAVEGEIGEFSNASVQGHIVEPRKLEIGDDVAGKLKAPNGFTVSIFAKDLTDPRMIAVAGEGTVYVTRRGSGDLLMIRDEDKDGKADRVQTVATRPSMHGIAIDGRTIYLATVKDVYKAAIKDDGALGELERIIDDLPDSGQHNSRTLGIGPDGMLYISVGSTCNACTESSPESATMLRGPKDGSFRTIHASGLRNTIGFAWHPETGALHGMDHGIDWLGDEAQVEELNLLEQGKTYGWPYIYGMGEFNPQDNPPGEITLADWKKASEEPLLGYTAHSAPMQMAFYAGGQFPAEYKGDAFVAMRGSWNRKEPSGYEVVRVRFEDGEPKSFEPFLTGFLAQDNKGHGFLGRPTGLAVMNDGSLLVGDDSNGVIYRVAYGKGTGGPGKPAAQETAAETRKPARDKAMKPSEIALELVEPKDKEPLEVTSEEIEAGKPIPPKYSATGEDISPPLAWSGAPDGTKSYVIIVDDPDVPAELKPFTHWVAYNIPADVRSLREGVAPVAMTEQPKNMEQGTNTRGSIGYFGPKPPAGDPPHNYHFQVFALDKALDLPPAPSREDVLTAMKGSVVAQGQLVGTFQN